MKARIIATQSQLNNIGIAFHVPNLLLSEEVEVRPIPNEDCVWVTCASLRNEFLVPVRFVEFIEGSVEEID